VETQKAFGCSRWKEPTSCKFVIWKKSKLPMFADEKMTAARVKKLLKGEAVTMKKLKSKAGNVFTADVKLKDNPNSQYGPDYELIFKSENQQPTETNKEQK
jgi:hypothetical protein